MDRRSAEGLVSTLIARGSAGKRLAELVPDKDSRVFIKTMAFQVKAPCPLIAVAHSKGRL